MKKFILFSIILMFALSVCIFATNKISPAVDVIANSFSMVKATVTNDGEMIFDVDDFDRAVGVSVQSIKITSLPDKNIGRLMLENLYVVENQVIYREDFYMLRFVQIANDSSSAVFKFKPNNSSYELECSLKSLKRVNLSPVASNGASVSTWTSENISCFGTLDGYDPEGDKLRFEVVSYPEKGLLIMTNTQTGDYQYIPYEDETGTDTFSYTVRDEFGNYSETSVVKMKIEKLKTSLVFSDFTSERYLNAAIIVHENDIMTATKGEDGSYHFKPEEKITFEEFVSLVMKAMGAKNVPVVDKTRFADDSSIKDEYKGYLESAFSLGIISGTNETDGVHINPKNDVTTAQAAIIINKIIGAKIDMITSVFADSDEIPKEAQDAISALTSLGILEKTNGKIHPNSPLTRAQTAQILMSLLEYRGKLNK